MFWCFYCWLLTCDCLNSEDFRLFIAKNHFQPIQQEKNILCHNECSSVVYFVKISLHKRWFFIYFFEAFCFWNVFMSADRTIDMQALVKLTYLVYYFELCQTLWGFLNITYSCIIHMIFRLNRHLYWASIVNRSLGICKSTESNCKELNSTGLDRTGLIEPSFMTEVPTI